MNADVIVKPLNLRHKTVVIKPRQNKKVRVSLSMSQDLLALIDEMRGLAARSAFVEKLLRDQLSLRGKEIERKLDMPSVVELKKHYKEI